MVRPKPGKPSAPKLMRRLIIIGFALGGLVLLAALVALGVYIYANHLKSTLTATAPLEIAPVEVTAVQKRQVEKVYTQVRQAMEQGRATEAVLAGEDLNALLALAPETRTISRRATVALDGDTVKATLSLPLDGVEGMQGRYLNGDFTFQVAVQDGKMQIKILSAVANQRPVPQYIINKLNERDLGQKVARRLGGDQVSRLDSLIIEDGQLKVRTKATR